MPPHIIPPESGMPPPKTPPMYIPTPKGWRAHYPQHATPPYIIPQEPLQVNHMVTLQVSEAQSQSKYVQAVKHMATIEISANAVADKETGRLLEYKHLIKGKEKDTQTKSCANESGCLAQGVGEHIKKGTNTTFL
eukprot:14043655-Ditylum_brightwellii.AAC.1